MSTIPVVVNGESRELPGGWTCRDLVADVTGKRIDADGNTERGAAPGVAVAIDGDIVPRSTWTATALAAGQRVELVTAVQGG